MKLAALADPSFGDRAPAVARYPGAELVALDDATHALLLGPLWRSAAPREGWEHTPLGLTANRALARGLPVDWVATVGAEPVALKKWPIRPPKGRPPPEQAKRQRAKVVT